MMMDYSRADYLAVELMLAYMEPSAVVRAAIVCQIEAESGLAADQFDLANITAWRAARFWLEFDPALGRRLLEAKRTELQAAVA